MSFALFLKESKIKLRPLVQNVSSVEASVAADGETFAFVVVKQTRKVDVEMA
jgi:hypothetical protein